MNMVTLEFDPFFQNINYLKNHDYLALANIDFTEEIIRIPPYVLNVKNDLKYLRNFISTYGLMIDHHIISTTIKALEIDALFTSANMPVLRVARAQLICILNYIYKKFLDDVILDYCQRAFPILDYCSCVEKKMALHSILKTMDILLLPRSESFLYVHSDVYQLLKQRMALCNFKPLNFIIPKEVKKILNYAKSTHLIAFMYCFRSVMSPNGTYELYYVAIHRNWCEDLESLYLRYSLVDAYVQENLDKAKELLEDAVEIFVKDIIFIEKDLYFYKLLKELYFSRQVPKLVIFTLIAIRKCSDSEIQKQIFHLIWKTVKDPYVTKKDLSELCQRCEDLDQELREILSEMPILYEQYFKDIATAKKSPRELAHLCQYQIRQILKENLNFPSGIYKLGLPCILQNSLKFC